MPADAFLRGSVLEERVGFSAARDAYEAADAGLYTPEARAARDAMLAHAVELVRRGEGLVVDIATGRGTLLQLLLGASARPLVATDLSPTVLAHLRSRLGEDRIRYVVADAHTLPFEDGSVRTLVSHVGLANVADAPGLLRELRRVGRELVTTHLFYPENDEANRAAARAHGLETLLVRDSALDAFAAAGWSVEIVAERAVTAEPTPESVLVPGVRIDALPVSRTTVTWCVLSAR